MDPNPSVRSKPLCAKHAAKPTCTLFADSWPKQTLISEILTLGYKLR